MRARQPQLLFFMLCVFSITAIIYLTRRMKISIVDIKNNISSINLYNSSLFGDLLYPNLVKRPRISAIMAVSPNISYLFSLPFAAAAWKRIGVEPIVLVVGEQEYLQKHHQAKVTLDLLDELGADVHFIQNGTIRTRTFSQISRLFAAAMPLSRKYDDKDIFITADADMFPFHLKNHIPNVLAGQKLYLYNADCTGPILVPPARGNYTVKMYLMGTIAATVSTWREIMGFLSTDFDGANIESYMKAEFGQSFFQLNGRKENDLQNSQLSIWYTDQSLVSYKIDEWFKSNPDNLAATTLTRGGCYPRINRIAWPTPENMAKLDINLLGDAHVIQNGFMNGQWELFRPLIELLFRGDRYQALRARFDQYRSDYIAIDCC